MSTKTTTRFRVILYSIIGIIIIAAANYGSGVYGKRVISVAESVSFTAPFPAGNVVKPVSLKTVKGISVFVKPVTIDLSKRGIFKKVFNPTTEKLVLNNLTNVDTKSHRIGLKLTNDNIRVVWAMRAGLPFDEENNTFISELKPGESVPSLKLGLTFYFPGEVRGNDVWYEGGLVVYDFDTNENLTTIPIKFIRGGN